MDMDMDKDMARYSTGKDGFSSETANRSRSDSLGELINSLTTLAIYLLDRAHGDCSFIWPCYR